MLRWLIVGSLLFGLGVGFRRGWIVVNWERMAADTHLPFLTDPSQPLRQLSGP